MLKAIYCLCVKRECECEIKPAIDLKQVRSVRSVSRSRNRRKSLPKAFEIFTTDHSSYVLKVIKLAIYHHVLDIRHSKNNKAASRLSVRFS